MRTQVFFGGQMAGWAWGRRGGRKPGAFHIARLTAIVALLWSALFFAAAARAAPCAAPPPANITMTPLAPGVVIADGVSSASAVVTLTDLAGHPVAGDSCLVVATSDGGTGSVRDNGDGTYTVAVTASTIVHQVMITVTETTTGISASQPLTQVAGPAHTVTVALASGVLVANGLSSTTATISVSDAEAHPIPGDAIVLSATDPGVHFSPVSDHGNGVYTATVFGSNTIGTDTIRATDISASPAPSGTATLTETRAPSLGSIAMQWTFFYTPAYTVVRSMVVNGTPRGASINLACHGAGCPFSTLKLKARGNPNCTRRSRRPCQAGNTLVLTPGLARRRLHVGTRLTVTIVRPGWIGKYYAFRIRSAKPPVPRITCLAPGGSRPGAGC